MELSNYKIGKIVKLILDLFVNYSTLPLKIVSGCGFLFFIVSFVAGIIVVIRKIFGLITVPGWASLILLFLFFSGMNMIVLGVVGEYVARIIKEVMCSKQYLIREKLNGD